MVTQGDSDIGAANRIRDLGGDALPTRITAVFNDYAAAELVEGTRNEGDIAAALWRQLEAPPHEAEQRLATLLRLPLTA